MYRITVPASSANMGPGFDSMGVALTLYNTIDFAPAKELSIRVEGECAERIPTTERNLVYATYRRTMEGWGRKAVPVTMVQHNAVPSTRGLGSSSTAIVGGVLMAYAISGRNYDRQEALNIATREEGHPDNVAPAIWGGFTVSFFDGVDTRCIRKDVGEETAFVAMIPEFELSTRRAREVVPKELSRADAVFNHSRTGYLAAAMMMGDVKAAAAAMDDRMHQHQRSALIPGYHEVERAAKAAGAMAVYLSGAGPTMMALVGKAEADGFVKAMEEAVKQLEHRWEIKPLMVCNTGATLENM